MSLDIATGEDVPKEIKDACHELNNLLMRCAVDSATELGYDESTPEKRIDKLNILLNVFCMCLVDLINVGVVQDRKEAFCSLVHKILMDNTQNTENHEESH